MEDQVQRVSNITINLKTKAKKLRENYDNSDANTIGQCKYRVAGVTENVMLPVTKKKLSTSTICNLSEVSSTS